MGVAILDGRVRRGRIRVSQPRLRFFTALVACVFLVLASAILARPGAAQTNPCDGVFCAGAFSVDTTWHTGAGQGQYGSDGNGLTSGKFDPFHHQTKQVPSDGVQSRTFTKAIVMKGPDGTKTAFVKTELYLQQDVLTRRVAQLVSGADPAVRDFVVEGLDGSRIMLGATHNHSVPMYASTAWGVWLFTDAFDFRMFEITARSIARVIKEADDTLRPAKVGASVTRFNAVQHNILGPGTADDGTPAGFPRDHFDDELVVVRFDEAGESGAPIAAWVNLGMHPESLETVNLISSDFVGAVERIVERGMGRIPGTEGGGPVVAWSQGSVGDVEPDRDERANPSSEKRQYWHKNFQQMERMSIEISNAVLRTWSDVANGTPDVEEKFVPFSTDAKVGMVDYRFAGPVSHPVPTVSNCRTERPGIPVVGLPDCSRLGTPPQQYGTTLGLLREAGVPIPDNIGSTPSYEGAQESLLIHLQAMRIGDILVTSCPCEPVSDMVINFKSRADEAGGNLYNGHEWTCREGGPTGRECDFRTASWRAADWRPVNEAAYQRMVAQIRNDAAGWEDDFESLQGEVEPLDPTQIKGNFTHSELTGGYRLPVMVGQGNDYVGYVVTYREYQRGDHYRKALTPFGPHTADYINTRLTRMGAELKGGEGPTDGAHEAAIRTLDSLINQGKAMGVGAAATGGLAFFEGAIPDDGGTPGNVISLRRLSQTSPATSGPLQRFGAASFTWEGGSNWTDNPKVVVQKLRDFECPGAGGICEHPVVWDTVATQEGGEVAVTLRYDSYASNAPLDWLTGGKRYEWTATWEVFDQTEPGTYRFLVNGHHRKNRTANPYTLLSEPFGVEPWKGIAAHDLLVDTGAGTASFRVSGVELSIPISQLETGDSPTMGPGEIHYPDTYSEGPGYISTGIQTSGSHRYCLRCSFRPWANTGTIESAKVTVHQSDGITKHYDASLVGSRWEATNLDLANGDVVVVETGGVVDQFGNINGSVSNVIDPLEGLEDREAGTLESPIGSVTDIVPISDPTGWVLAAVKAGAIGMALPIALLFLLRPIRRRFSKASDLAP